MKREVKLGQVWRDKERYLSRAGRIAQIDPVEGEVEMLATDGKGRALSNGGVFRVALDALANERGWRLVKEAE